MVYSTTEWDLRTLIDYYNNNQINLNPPYQRGDIWSAASKKRLIESIKSKYPLPLFFLYQTNTGIFDMVDGQQRTRTILGYAKGLFADTEKKTISDTDSTFFYNEYKISVCVITHAEEGEVEDFYFRVNKFGSKLNRPEILKAQFRNSVLQNLVETISDSPQFTSLNIFTTATLNRLSDLDFIGELLTLTKDGITDKKIAVDRFYEATDFTESASKELEVKFYNVLDDVIRFNEIYAIGKTRYKQRNDFYTLFNFLLNTREIHKETLDYFYKLLVVIDPDISPSQENCFAFREYATNCVTQSNSKKAREERLRFFNEILLNKDCDVDLNDDSESSIKDLLLFYRFTSEDLVKIEDFYVLNVNKLIEITSRHFFDEIG
ncbi:hypothetical protein GCM10027037_12640 [Mucilaginibacter koreensis]